MGRNRSAIYRVCTTHLHSRLKLSTDTPCGNRRCDLARGGILIRKGHRGVIGGASSRGTSHHMDAICRELLSTRGHLRAIITRGRNNTGGSLTGFTSRVVTLYRG